MDIDPDALSAAWLAAQDRLPDGWRLEGLRCGSTGLTQEQRSEDWVAVATGADGVMQIFQSADPFDALDGVVASVSSESSEPTPSLDRGLTDEDFWAAAAERGKQRPTSDISMLVPSSRAKG